MNLSAGESSIMPKTVIPAGYRPALGLYDTQKAIGLIKQIFLLWLSMISMWATVWSQT